MLDYPIVAIMICEGYFSECQQSGNIHLERISLLRSAVLRNANTYFLVSLVTSTWLRLGII